LPVKPLITSVPFHRVLDRMDMLADHYEELATDKSRMELAPWVEAYAKLDAEGALFTVGAIDQGELIGYSANFVSPAMHYRHLSMCQNDVLFVAKPYRSGRLGLQLIAATEAEAKRRGAGMMLWHAKEGTALDKLLRRKGYRVQDVVYSRGL
jgi:GNAT superfamily N-acetyltransferase